MLTNAGPSTPKGRDAEENKVTFPRQRIELFFYDQHRAACIAQRSLRDTPQQKTMQAGPAVASHDNHRGTESLRLARDHSAEIGAACQSQLAILGLKTFTFQEFPEILARLS